MRTPNFPFRRHALALAAGLSLMAFGTHAIADPPGRVARLGYLSGTVSFSPAGEDSWSQATMNRPLSPGDRLWAETGSRAEIQVGGAMLRLNAGTAVSVLNLDDNITQLQLTEGSLYVHVRRLEPDQSVEVDTPHLAFTLREPAVYRIDVDADGNATTIDMREGRGEVTGEGESFLLEAAQVQRFTGTGLRDEAFAGPSRRDDFDRWSDERDRANDRSISARYVSPDVVGYQDLDTNGTWRVDASYGHVWYPSRVAVGWAPYRDGHWAWVDPWGWTWVDDAPWGFAVSHYGRWANFRGTWGWIPGPVRSRAYYAPALVVFVGGDNFKLKITAGGIGGIAWFPLGPREVYRPAYKVSPAYFEKVNISNTVVNKTVVNNVYINKTVNNITYVNRKVPGAVVAVPKETFAQSQPVAKAAVRPSKELIDSREVADAAPVAPTEKSVRGAAADGAKPPARAFVRPVVARTAPPAAKASFAVQKERLAAQPGKPLDEVTRKELKAPPNAAAPAAPAVKVVPARQVAAKALPPTASAPARSPKERDDRARPAEERKAAAAKAGQAASSAEARTPKAAATKPGQAASSAEDRGPKATAEDRQAAKAARAARNNTQAEPTTGGRDAASAPVPRPSATRSAAERKADRAAKRGAPASEGAATAPARASQPAPSPQARANPPRPTTVAQAAEPLPAASQPNARQRERQEQRRDETPNEVKP